MFAKTFKKITQFCLRKKESNLDKLKTNQSCCKDFTLA